jgi:hypothetical protein
VNGTEEGAGGAERVEGVVRETFHRGLDGMPAGFAPVEAAMRQGRGIRTRRRVTAGGSLVLAAAIVAGIAGMLRVPARTAPPVKHPVVHKLSQAPGSAAEGRIAAGVMDGKSWEVDLVDTGTGGCWISGRYGGQTRDLADSCGVSSGAAASPMDFVLQSSDGSVLFAVGTVAADVTSIDVELTDDETARLTPVPLNAAHYVAMVMPADLGVVRATAHSSAGDRYTLPYPGVGGLISIGAWYDKGQTAPSARTSVTFPVWGASPQTAPVTVAIGPWGRCFVFTGDLSGVSPECDPQAGPTPQDHLHIAGTDVGGAPGNLIFGEVDPVVTHVVFPLDGGGDVDARVTTVDGHAYICVLARGGVHAGIKYDAAGHVVPSS